MLSLCRKVSNRVKIGARTKESLPTIIISVVRTQIVARTAGEKLSTRGETLAAQAKYAQNCLTDPSGLDFG